jgi:hypothetical protein
MKYIIPVILTTDEGQTEAREIACLERENLTPTTLGLSLNEGKAILKALQAVVVEGQMTAHLGTHRSCPHCGQLRHSMWKSSIHISSTIRASFPTMASTTGTAKGSARALWNRRWTRW